MKKITLVGFLIAVLLVFTSCSSGNNSTSKLQEIKQKGELVMLTNATFPPFEYIGQGGKVSGIDADIIQEVANDIGVNLKIVNLDFDFLIDSLKSGKGDIVASGMTVTEERKKQVDFSDRYITSSQYAMVRKGSGITIDQINKVGTELTFSVQEGTKGEFYAVDDLGAEAMLYKNATDASQALISDKVSVCILDELVARNIVGKNSDSIEIIEQPLTQEDYAFAIAKGSDDLLEQVNKTIARLKSEGKIEELAEKYSDI